MGRVILPFTLLRRLEGVLEEAKPAVLAEHEKIKQVHPRHLASARSVEVTM